MATYEAHALPADWLNGWLASIGVTLLVPGSRLGWSSGPKPHAIFDTVDGSIVDQVAEALPTLEDFDRMAIARVHPDSEVELPRNVTLAAFAARALLARRGGDPMLAATLTDLGPTDRATDTIHSPFDPPAPKGITIWERARSCRQLLSGSDEERREQLDRSFTVGGERVANNGLGFDYRRILSPTDPGGDVWVDPVVEVLALLGLAGLPVRGDGTHDRTRGWTARALARGSFTWPAWRPLLSGPAIDGMLDQFWADGSLPDERRRPRASDGWWLGVFASVPYQPRGQMDQTRAYASERVL
jgi:hypothetical protein